MSVWILIIVMHLPEPMTQDPLIFLPKEPHTLHAFATQDACEKARKPQNLLTCLEVKVDLK